MASLKRDSVTERDKSRAVTAPISGRRERDTRDNNPIGVVTLSRPARIADAGAVRIELEDRLDLIEAILFELLHLATPEEAAPRIARRLAGRAPTFGGEGILASMLKLKSPLAAEGPMP